MKSACTRILLALLVLCSQIQLASAQNSENATYCVNIFQKMNRDIQFGYVTPLTQERIFEYFSDSTLTPQERASKAFVAVTSDRLNLLPQEDADKVIQFLHKRVVRTYIRSANFINGTFSDNPFVKQKISLFIPENFLDGIIEYTILTHELEHYIQTQQVTKHTLGKTKLLVDSFTNFVEHNYEREFGAMLAEFQFIKTIPLEIRKQARKEIEKNDLKIKQDTLNFLLLLLDTEANHPLEYIKTQHNAGRYDKGTLQEFQQDFDDKYGSFKMQILFLAASSGSIPTMMGISGAIDEIKVTCDKWVIHQNSLPKDLQETSAFFQFCKTLQNQEK